MRDHGSWFAGYATWRHRCRGFRGRILAALIAVVAVGACGETMQGDRVCRDQSSLGVDGSCPASLAGCVIFGSTPTNTCAELCTEMGETCVARGCDGLTARGFPTEETCENNESAYTDVDSTDDCDVSLLNVVVGCCCSDSH